MHALARTPAVVVALVLAAGAAATPIRAAPAPPLWDHVGYDAEDSWSNPRESAITADTVRRLVRKWSVPLRSAETCSSFSGPIVAGGRVFVGDLAGITAYDAATGTRRWSHDWNGAIEGGTPRMAVAGGLLVVGYNDCMSVSDPNPVLVALDVRSGLLRWSASSPLVGTMIVDKGAVLVSGTDVSGDSETVTYRVSDGRELWKAPGRRVGGSSANGVVAGFAAGGSKSFDIVTGAVRWSTRLHLRTEAANPAGDVFYGADDRERLVAVNVGTGAVRWTAPGPTELIAADGNRLYRSDGEAITALDARTGKQVWRRDLPRYGGQPVVAGGVVYAGGIALDAARGTVITGTLPLGGELIVTGGVLYQSHEGSLTAYAVTGSGRSAGRTGRR
ncbi:PQQ-binding-like beta-propeller repeat protein [Actinoplanes sp. CA-252034]|uniref:outer membrane protein assembly factor BamB family protein n=1 Tax=Actinoplanes sp. CA-252034 TaxID=3239906 RepID=UPI003D980B45